MKKRVRTVTALAAGMIAGMAAAMSAGTAMTAWAGQWQEQDNIWKYQEDDSSFVEADWKEIDGSWYYFDEEGVMVIGDRTIDGRRERFGGNGVWQGTVSQIVEATVSTFVNSGPGAGQWEQDERGWRYVRSDGSSVSGAWEKVQGDWYYFADDGYMRANTWIMTDGKVYRVGEDGRMLTGPGKIQVDGIEYELNGDGSRVDPPKTEEDLQAEAIASGILASITNDSMSKTDKARAIYSYVRGHMTYSHVNTYPSNYTEAAAALYGFRRHSGNCYVYYSMSHFLLELAGMPNIRLVRASDGDHFWNLVNVDGTWYHFDATPRSSGGTWCLVTTDYLRSHSWGAHNYDVAAYPATP